ncbi:MAG TPA: hypothetical protein PK625_09375 [Spirochaetales bacterium]|nr:hypothetical protein [Spirochaetales bacterium]MBP7263652.1 hypothetical protein [Spirochaetia bacterium]HPE37350.1 hypothetical protein [Spirochaetales bacterium]
MTIRELGTELGFQPVQDHYQDRPLDGGYTSDLLSDVMAKAGAGSVLLTIQAHKNTVAVASLANLAAIVLCGGRKAPEDMLDAARAEGLAVFATDLDQFHATGLVYQAMGGGAGGR